MDVIDLKMEQAACTNTDVNVFFPELGKGYSAAIQMAKAICSSCPIKEDCMQVAVENNYDGVWGGTTLLERENFKRRMRRSRLGRIHERSLANLRVDKQVRNLHLVAANAARAEKNASRSVELVTQALQKLGDNIPDNLAQVAKVRLDNPTANLQQLADTLGITKDAYSGAIRRLLKRASK